MIQTHSLNGHFETEKKYEFCLSLEVAEHLKQSSSSVFIDTLISLEDNIIFSAAFPGQTGQGHINEQL
jgi:hypothetical protein